MRWVRTCSGLLALVGLAVGLNIVVLRQNPFTPAVIGAFGVSVFGGAAWIGLLARDAVRHSAKEGRSLYGLNAVLGTLLFLGICIVIYAFADRFDRSWDLTQEGRRKLSEQTVQVLETLNEDVSVVCFFLQIDDELVRIAQEKTRRFLEQCQGHTTRLHVEFLDPQVERPRLEALNITHASTQGTVVVRCGSRQRVITLSGGSPRLEEKDFTNALVNVMRDAQPKICFLTGHGERSIDDGDEKNGGSMLKNLLEGESYVAERTAIMITRPEVDPSCEVLVINGLGIAGAQSDLHPAEIKAVEAFLDRGGRLLVLLDPWRKIVKDNNQVEQLLPWLGRRFGIVVGNDMAVSPETKWNIDLSGDVAPFGAPSPDDPFRGCFNAGHGITRNADQKMALTAVRTVDLESPAPEGVVGDVLLRTTPNYYAETDVEKLSSTGQVGKSPEEREGPLPVAVAVTMKTESETGEGGQTRDARIVAMGDSDFASNGQLTTPGNLNFVLNTMAWLTEREDLIAIRPTGKEDGPVLLSEFDQRTIVWISVLGTVQAVAAAALVAHILRRRHQ